MAAWFHIDTAFDVSSLCEFKINKFIGIKLNESIEEIEQGEAKFDDLASKACFIWI